MNILFIYSLYDIASPRKPLVTPEVMQFGISYISSYLKSRGHNTGLGVLSRISGQKNKEMIDERIKDIRPGAIFFTAVSTEYDFISSLARYIRDRFPEIYLVIGGPHVSLNPEGVLGNFDAVCIGEGEEAALELVGQLEKGLRPSGIPNMWLKNGERIEKNPTRPFRQNLDDLPFPDREMWKEWIDEVPAARESILLGRGCPFDCTYCCNHALRKLSTGNYTRYRSPDNILSEIETLAAASPLKREIYLEVENIGSNKEWVLELCSKIEGLNKTLTNPLSFGVNIRITPGLDTNAIFSALKRGNFRFINIGLESGSERVRREILNRNYSNKDIIDAVKLARSFGLQVSLLNLVGIFGETLSDFEETVRINRICQPDWVGVSIFYPYPGTRLYSLCRQKGLLDSAISTEMERGRAVLDLQGFGKRQIEHNYACFEYLVYKGHKPAYKLLSKAAFLKIRGNPFLFSLYRKFKSLVNLTRAGRHPSIILSGF